MKLRITTRHLPNPTNHYRNLPSNTLLTRHLTSILISSPYHPRRAIRMTYPQYTCQRGLHLLHMHLPPHWPRTLLWLIPIQRNLKHRNHPTIPNYGHCIRRLRPTMRSNIILRRHCHHQPTISHPLHRQHPCTMNLRRILSRQCHPNPILYLSLSTPLCHCRFSSCTFTLPPRNRIKQSNRIKLER